MMFLASSADNSPAIGWLRVLDFLQVAIVAATRLSLFLLRSFSLAIRPRFPSPANSDPLHRQGRSSLCRILPARQSFPLSLASLFLCRHGGFLPHRCPFRRRLSLYTWHLLWCRQLGRPRFRVTVSVRHYFCGHLETRCRGPGSRVSLPLRRFRPHPYPSYRHSPPRHSHGTAHRQRITPHPLDGGRRFVPLLRPPRHPHQPQTTTRLQGTPFHRTGPAPFRTHLGFRFSLEPRLFQH